MLILHFSGFEHFALPLFRFAGTDLCCWSSVSYEMLLNSLLGAIYTYVQAVQCAPCRPLWHFPGSGASVGSCSSIVLFFTLSVHMPWMYRSSFLVAVAMIGPFIASVALILIIPIGFVTDYVLGNWDPATKTTLVLALEIAGCALIVIGFALLQWASRVEGKKKCRRGNARKYCECIIC